MKNYDYRNMIKNGYKQGIVKLIESPHDDGIVCKIGDTWFYFGGFAAEECSTVAEYVKCIPTENLVKEIFEVLSDFYDNGDELKDEYLYYEAILREHGITE